MAGRPRTSLTLASFLQAFGDAGLALRSVREFVAPGGGILPWDLALLAEKPRQIPRASR